MKKKVALSLFLAIAPTLITLLSSLTPSDISSSPHFFIPSSLSAQIPSNGLVAWYPLTQDHKDISGNGYHLLDSINVNSRILPEKNRFGRQSKSLHNLSAYENGWSLKLDGFAPLSADFTLTFWVNVSIPEQSNAELWLLELNNPEIDYYWEDAVFIGITSLNEWGLMPTRYMEHEINYFTSDFFAWESQLPSTKWVGLSQQDDSQQLSDWHHLAVVCENKNLQFYIDGMPVTISQSNLIGRFMSDPLQEINLYREAFYEDLMIYNRSMQPSEIKQLFSYQLMADLPLESISDINLNCTDTTAHLDVNIPQPLGWMGIRDVMFESVKIEMSLSNDAGWSEGYWGWAMDTIAVNAWNQNLYFELPMIQKSISSTLSSLSKGTTYFVRSYFRSNDQFFWSDSLTFTTANFTPGSGVTDIDGNQYPTMIYGQDEWMIRDLITTHFNDGTPIDKLLCNDADDCDIYRWFENSQLGNPTCVSVPDREDVLLYDVNVVSCIGDVCPIGWHISTGDDWMNLFNVLKLEPSLSSVDDYTPFNTDLTPLLSNGENPYQFSLSTCMLQGSSLIFQNPIGLAPEEYVNGYYDLTQFGFQFGYWMNNSSLYMMSSWYSGNQSILDALNLFEITDGFPIRCVKNRAEFPIPVVTLTHLGCSNPVACNYACGVSSNTNETCIIENQPCEDGSTSSVNDMIENCQCKGNFGVSPHDTIFDIEGNSYATIQIGNQIWMQQNLRTTYFNNGEYAGSLPLNPPYVNEIMYPENVADFDRYGFYYDQSVLLDNRNICPVGWKVPSTEDWVTLFTFLQPQSFDPGYWPVARFLKSNQSSNDYWNEYAVNSAQMNIVPNGQYTSLSGSNIPAFIYWWYNTTLLQTEEGAWLWSGTENKMQWKSTSDFVTEVPYLEQDKLGIRCIKEN